MRFINAVLFSIIICIVLFGVFLAGFYLVFRGETREFSFYMQYIITFLVVTLLAVVIFLIFFKKFYGSRKHAGGVFLVALGILILLSVIRFQYIMYAFQDKGKTGSAGLEEADYITLINRWHYDLMDDDYRLFALISRASLQDKMSDTLLDDLHILPDSHLPEQLERNMAGRYMNTHSFSGFSNLPGNNPWGATDEPVFRKLLPVEMRAMEKLTGKISGDCAALANISLVFCRKLGISAENIFILRSKMHASLLIQYKGEVYIFETPELNRLTGAGLFFYNILFNTGFYNDRYYARQGIILNKRKLTGEGTLKEKLEKKYGIQFRDLNTMERGERNAATAACLQQKSMLQQIIRASCRGPLVRDLTAQMLSPQQLGNWIGQNIALHSISDFDFVMTADQVLVFRQGNDRDLAVLFLSVCLIRGSHCALYTDDDAFFVEMENRYFRVKDGLVEEMADAVQGARVLFE